MLTFTRRAPRRTQIGGYGVAEIGRFSLLIFLVYVVLHFTHILVFMHCLGWLCVNCKMKFIVTSLGGMLKRKKKLKVKMKMKMKYGSLTL